MLERKTSLHFRYSLGAWQERISDQSGFRRYPPSRSVTPRGEASPAADHRTGVRWAVRKVRGML